MRIEDILYDLETSEGGAPVSGTGETSTATTDPSAGTQNTDTGQGDGPPETIPYSRFKEVNDQLGELRPYKDLQNLGYDADSLRQLAEFEAGFQADPARTWLTIADNIEQLPPEVKEAVKRHLGSAPSGDSSSQSGQSSQDGDGEPASVKELRAKLDRLEQSDVERQRREASDASNQILDGVMAAWRSADEADGLKPLSEQKMLTYIIAHARSTNSPEELLRAARQEWHDTREEVLSSSMPKPGGNANAPRPVPGSGAPLNFDEPPKTLAEASMRAKARLAAMEE